ncbi:MAG: 4'-phosphopantetheinyl transferase superfamily protein [Bacteroidetes bacterium]|nr:4'-phosphopantetheinyl transferase superfamily protein [Bacteroidota bacterium]
MKWKESDIVLQEAEKKRYSVIQNSERKNEFLGVRYLRNQYDAKLEIKYLSSGKPVIENDSKHISISHSKNYVAFAVAPYKIGIDIEEIHERILKVKGRFLNQSELELFNLNSLADLTIAWCAKETLFKLNDDSGLDFKTDLIIKNWDKNSTILAEMKQNSQWVKVNLHFEVRDDLVLCFNFE